MPANQQPPPGYVLDPPLINSTSPLSQADLQALHDQAQRAQQAQETQRPAKNPFDQFDPPPAKAVNPFDQFDPPAAAKTGGTGQQLTDAQLLFAPGPTAQATDAQLLAAPGPTNALPPGFTLDPPPAPGLLNRVGGIIGRGVLEGAAGVVGAAQAAGRYVDNHLPSTSFEQTLDNLPVQQLANDAEDKAGFYKPQYASGKILEGAVGGATGAALTGGIGELAAPAALLRAAPEALSGFAGGGTTLGRTALSALPAGAAAGSVVPLAKASGASDDTANDLGLAASVLLPGAIAARNIAGAAAKSVYVNSLAKGMTPEQAMQHVMLHDAAAQFASTSGGALTPAQAAQDYGTALNSGLAAYRKAGVASGGLDADQSSALTSAQNAANAGTGGSAAVKGLGLPDYHQDAVGGAIGQLDALNSQAPNVGRVGPLASVASKAAPVIGAGAALHSIANGDIAGGLELGGAAIGSQYIPGVTPVMTAAGKAGDFLLGSGITPQAAQLAAAQRVFSRSGLALPSTSPLTDLQSAVSDVRGSLQDQANNAANATADALQAKQTATAYAQNSKASQAAEAAWQGAMAQQAKQAAGGNPDPLSTALWKDAEQQQQ